MKRLFFTTSLAVCLLSLSAFGTETYTPDILKSVYRTFQNVRNVIWTQIDNIPRIGFIADGRQQFAYYLNDELIVVVKEIATAELPAFVKIQIENTRTALLHKRGTGKEQGERILCPCGYVFLAYPLAGKQKP